MADHFDRVLVGVDGRPSGRDAIALARLLVAGDGRTTLVHIHPGSAATADWVPAATDDDDARSRELLERERDACAVDAELAVSGAPSVGRGLHDAAEAAHADLLVVGSCSRGFAGRVLVGNDTRAALNGSPCAVAVAPLGYARDMGRLATIGVGYDGSPESVAALALARELAGRHGARVRALTVVQIPGAQWAGYGGLAWGSALDEIVAEAQAALDRLVDDTPPGGAELVGETAIGVPGEELAAFGERVDLLVVGSRGYGPVRRLIVGSSSEHLASHARCPLLVLPRAALAPSATGAKPPQS